MDAYRIFIQFQGWHLITGIWTTTPSFSRISSRGIPPAWNASILLNPTVSIVDIGFLKYGESFAQVFCHILIMLVFVVENGKLKL